MYTELRSNGTDALHNLVPIRTTNYHQRESLFEHSRSIKNYEHFKQYPTERILHPLQA